MDEDPVFQLFPGQDEVDLYAVLGLNADCTQDAIKKTYRKLALLYHPDKHSASSTDTKREASVKFQQVGYAYAVLSDEKRRKRYDETGRTDEDSILGFGPADGDEGGWEAYFAGMFEEVTRKRLDELKKEYQGSQEEKDDVQEAYVEGEGDIEYIMAHIPHSMYEDEPRIISIVKKLIKSKKITSLPKWEADLKDEKAKKQRKKQGEAEAKEAEETAKEMGVWDEFYGSAKGKGKSGKGRKKRARDEEDDSDEEETSKKRSRKTPELDDAEFERIQKRLQNEKAKNVAERSKRK
ncbi:hypothetical protein FRB91_000407 [Serendipita sp. 411]|nr:hypothetical protein FRB91_000407 [Serendipita sp. 411]